jgi:hypothetical protein
MSSRFKITIVGPLTRELLSAFIKCKGNVIFHDVDFYQSDSNLLIANPVLNDEAMLKRFNDLIIFARSQNNDAPYLNGKQQFIDNISKIGFKKYINVIHNSDRNPKYKKIGNGDGTISVYSKEHNNVFLNYDLIESVTDKLIDILKTCGTLIDKPIVQIVKLENKFNELIRMIDSITINDMNDSESDELLKLARDRLAKHIKN